MPNMHLIKGILASISIFVTTVVVWIPLAFWILQSTWARGESRSRLKHRMDKIIWWWTGSNRRMFEVLKLSDVQIYWPERAQVSPEQWYLVICNHQTWVDIVLLQSHLYGVMPPLKFFTKAQLIWLPFIGLAMSALGFPYVKRATKAQIKANPKLRHADRDNVAQACEGFKNHPTSILNFVEGTRRTAEKHERQGSDYRHLLRPKVGGLGYVLDGMHQHLHKMIDVTIVYPDGTPTFWEFIQGKCPRVEFHVRHFDMPVFVDLPDDSERRSELARWLKGLWIEKDQLLDTRMQQTNG